MRVFNNVISIRPSTDRDAAALQAIYSEAVTNADWLQELAKRAPVFSDVSVGEVIHVTANEDGQVLGFVSVQTGDPFIHHLFVYSDARGSGVGLQLLESLKSWLPRPWRLKCVCRNVRALAFYQRNGWREVGLGESEHGAYAVLVFD